MAGHSFRIKGIQSIFRNYKRHGKYSDEFGIGEALGDDTFSKDGLVWIPNILENWRSELPNEPSTMKVELYFNGTLAVRMSK